MKQRYIVVEGPIGCGKTSLAHKLAQKMGADLLLEEPSSNPFLRQFYQDMRRFALPTQLFFLFQRVEQVGALKQPDLFAKPTVADFTLAKDPLFARLTLNDAEYQLYSRIYEHVRPQAPVPDLVIYLQASVDTLIDRVKRRGHAFEGTISEDYLRKLSEAYSRYFHSYDESPLLMVNSERLNFVDNPAHLDLLIERMNAMRGGREFFNRA
ncbi:Deoxyguanosine kinase [Usitatibacter rugosus]|uniref:Deoxyguanosine kinase n=1 Tax=Usitatibacter rugosus TaxID=2732067 RepID=A0A6M4GU04_9PROT|nr:deoxynucleoside kinase [Usitatibacter rugosus]QJR09813.1 Deoxyguanosine kinase [Usitatibacter rugosus]